jgi:MoaA/NifB/PqqE/SkfB family radical SAM enzyme
MNISRLGASLFDSRFGRYLLDITTRLVYIDWLRKPLVYGMDRLLQGPRSRDGADHTGWHKIRQQYRDVSRAVLHSLDRAIEKRFLAPHVARLIFNLWGRALFPSRERVQAVQRFRDQYGSAPPWFLVISPTRSCNLKCSGCYANSGPGTDYPEQGQLHWDMLDRIITEARQRWGVALFVFSGGEPLTYRSQGKDLLDLVEKHKDCLFLMFTNGTLITAKTAQRLGELGNLTPALSVEGLREQTDQRRGSGIFHRVLDAMTSLREVGVPFGISITATSSNCEQILSDQLLDCYFEEQGAFYAFIFQYMPIGRFPDLDCMPKPEQRIPFWKRSWEVVRQRHLFLLDFWNHGPMVEGCIAAGRERGYMHIDWNGDVMPCVFMPYAAANVPEIYARGGTLNDIWSLPFFRTVRQWQREVGYGRRELSKEGNWLLPCPFRDHFATFRTWISSLEPEPQKGVAPEMLMDAAFCEKMLAYGTEQARLVQPLWEKEYLP